jgi:hypothetical protein
LYNQTKTKVEDTAAMDVAAKKVCSRWRSHLDGQTGTAAMHLRIGDTLMSRRQRYARYAPAEMYGVVAERLKSAKVDRIALFYHPTRGVPLRKKNNAIIRCDNFIAILEGVLEPRGLEVYKAPSGFADNHFCEMLAAPVFVPSGGGYSHLIKLLRERRGDSEADLPYRWWCDEAVMATPGGGVPENLVTEAARECKHHSFGVKM